METTVRYGREELSITLPDSAAVITARQAEALPEAALKEKLLALVPQGRRLGILLPDRTRPLPVKTLLDWLLPELTGREVTLFLGTGIHRSMTEAEVSDHVGERGRLLRVVPNTPDNRIQYACMGITARGTTVELLREAVEQDALLGLTLVRPHYYAGFSGGRKILLPGIASRSCIQGNHSLVLDPDPSRGKHPRAVLGVLEGNPVAEDMMEAAALVPIPVALAHFLMRDGRLLDCLPEFAPAVDRVRALGEAAADRPYDAVVASAGGHPYDTDFIQGHKALENAVGGLKPGGTLYAYIAAPEGFGSPDCLEFLRLGSVEAAGRRLREAFKVYGHTALAMLMKGNKYDIRLHTELPDEHVRLMGYAPWDGRLPGGLPAATAFLPQGGSVYFPQ